MAPSRRKLYPATERMAAHRHALDKTDESFTAFIHLSVALRDIT
jgi:hypothetical protein